MWALFLAVGALAAVAITSQTKQPDPNDVDEAEKPSMDSADVLDLTRTAPAGLRERVDRRTRLMHTNQSDRIATFGLDTATPTAKQGRIQGLDKATVYDADTLVKAAIAAEEVVHERQYQRMVDPSAPVQMGGNMSKSRNQVYDFVDLPDGLKGYHFVRQREEIGDSDPNRIKPTVNSTSQLDWLLHPFSVSSALFPFNRYRRMPTDDPRAGTPSDGAIAEYMPDIRAPNYSGRRRSKRAVTFTVGEV